MRSPHEDVRRGAAMYRFLEDRDVQEVLAELRQEIITQWANSHPTETEDREKLWLKVRIFDELQDRMKAIAESGRRSQYDIEQDARRKND